MTSETRSRASMLLKTKSKRLLKIRSRARLIKGFLRYVRELKKVIKNYDKLLADNTDDYGFTQLILKDRRYVVALVEQQIGFFE